MTTTQPPSREEVQQAADKLRRHRGANGGYVFQPQADLLESLLADNVRLSTESRNMQTLAQGYKNERDQLRARIGELEQAGRITGWHMEGNLRVFDCLTYTSGTTAYVKREDYDERIAALEKALSHMQWCSSCAEGSWEDCECGREALAALNPHASGTAVGREGY